MCAGASLQPSPVDDRAVLPRARAVFRRHGVEIAGLFLLALAARIFWVAWTSTIPDPFSDANYYDTVARSLLHGLGYTISLEPLTGFIPGGEPTAFWPPGYSHLLAFSYLFHEGIGSAKMVNALAGALAVIPIYAVGFRLGGKPVAIVAGLLMALSPSPLFWTPVLYSDTVFMLLFASIVALAFWNETPTRYPRLALLGIALGCATLVRGQALALIPALAAWWLWRGFGTRRTLIATGIVTAVGVGMLVPWLIRNQVVMGTPVLSTNMGYNLRMGHADYARGDYIRNAPDLRVDLSHGIENSLTTSERSFNEDGASRALDYALHHPARELQLSLSKVRALFQADFESLDYVETFGATPLPSGARSPLGISLNIVYYLTLGLAGLALLSRRWDILALPVLVLLTWVAVHIVFFGEGRFHLPLYAVLMPMAAFTLVQAWRKARTISPRGTGRS